jgi:hypothetical protein
MDALVYNSPRKLPAIRMPMAKGALAPAADNAYILRMNATKVKPEKLPDFGGIRR